MNAIAMMAPSKQNMYLFIACQFLRFPESLEETSPARQAQSPPARTADSSSTKAVNFSFARTMKRFPLRCASAIQIVRPLESHG
jgi:hypothetical protein